MRKRRPQIVKPTLAISNMRTKFTARIEIEGQKPVEKTLILHFGRSKAVDHLKGMLAYPGWVFASLRKTGKAELDFGTEKITVLLEEFEHKKQPQPECKEA